MPYTREAAIQMLKWGADPISSPLSHKQIAEWCYSFWCQFREVNLEAEIESLLSIIADVDAQWELYLVNTYSLEELQTKNLEHEQMPREWFDDWLRQIA